MKTALTVTPTWSKQVFQVELEKNKSIKIDCTYANHINPKPTSVEFKIGDTAEYDSYNLSYMGTIVGITEKTVRIKPRHETSTRMLKLGDFCNRNWDFNLEKKMAENQETSYSV